MGLDEAKSQFVTKRGQKRSSKQKNRHWKRSAAPRNTDSPDGRERESTESTHTGEGAQEETHEEHPGGDQSTSAYADLQLKNHRERG